MKPVPKSPRRTSILVTSRCNLACRHCSVYGEGEIKGDLSLDTWCSVLDRLAEWKVLNLTVSGGEPLIRDDFPEMLGRIAKRPFRFSVNTNATLVNEEVTQAFKNAMPRLTDIMVSLDGATPQTHDAQRKAGSFEKMERGVKMLANAGLPLGFYCTVTTLNVSELEAVAEFAHKYGGGYIKFNDVLAVGRACDDIALGLSFEARLDAAERVAKLREKYGNFVTGTLLDMYDFSKCINEGEAREYPQGSRGCGAMRGTCCIWPDGRMTPCDRIPHYTIGNVLGGKAENTLPSIWQNEQANEFRNMLATPISELATCSGCDYLKYCTGGCPVLPMKNDDKILARDPKGCIKLFRGEESLESPNV